MTTCCHANAVSSTLFWVTETDKVKVAIIGSNIGRHGRHIQKTGRFSPDFYCRRSIPSEQPGNRIGCHCCFAADLEPWVELC